MTFTKEEVIKLIIEEVRKIQSEDLSRLNFLTPQAALSFMRQELSNKTLVFFDLETVGFAGQITQVAAFTYKIKNLDSAPPASPKDEFLAKIELSQDTLDLQDWERKNQRDVLYRKKNWKRYSTVDDMLKYTHYDSFIPDFEPLPEQQVIADFFEWISGIDNAVLVGHNIKSFDLSRLLKRAKEFRIPTAQFEKSDIFDTRSFAETIFKNSLLIARNYNDEVANELIEFTEEQKIKFNGKLDKLMKIFNDSSREQLHTADDDTKQLVDVFFAMYKKILSLEKEHAKEFSSKHRKPAKMRVELYKHMRKMGMFTDSAREAQLKRITLNMPHNALESLIMKIRSEPDYTPEL